MNTSVVCGMKTVNLGLNPSGIAYYTPNNPLDFQLANMRYGVANGSFMKSTPTGKKLPNPATALASYLKKPLPKQQLPDIGPAYVNQYISNKNVNAFGKARASAMARQNLKARLRGKIAVSGNKKGILRELKLDRKFAVNPVQEVSFDIRANPPMTVRQIAAENRALNPSPAPRNPASTAYDDYLRQYMREQFGYVDENLLRGDDEGKEDSPNPGDDETKYDNEEKRPDIENPEEMK